MNKDRPRVRGPSMDVCLTAMDCTPDGFIEAVLTVNDRLIATAVVAPDVTHEEWHRQLDSMLALMFRKC